MAKRGRPKKNNDSDSVKDSVKPKRKYNKKNKEESKNIESTDPIIEHNVFNQYTDINYVQSLKYDWMHPSKLALLKANNELHKSYKTWDELSSDGNLSESFIDKYENEINWYYLLKHQKNYSESFIKRHKDHFIIMRLGLV